jgi:hypothetical protein
LGQRSCMSRCVGVEKVDLFLKRAGKLCVPCSMA